MYCVLNKAKECKLVNLKFNIKYGIIKLYMSKSHLYVNLVFAVSLVIKEKNFGGIVMTEKYYKKDGRQFVVRFEKGGKIFIGTAALISDIAAQLITREVVAPLNWKPTGSYMDLKDSFGSICTAIGYKIPPFTSARRKINKLFK